MNNNTNFKDIRVTASQLEFKNNTGKTLEKIFQPLQTNSIHHNVLVGQTSNKEAAINMANGEVVIIPNNLNLKSGDRIDIAFSLEFSKIKGTITEINGGKISQNTNNIFYLKKENTVKTNNPIIKPALEINIDLTKALDISTSINGFISYLNLSKLTNNYNILSLLKSYKTGSQNIPITLRIQNDIKNSNNLYQINAEVSSLAQNNLQLLKTNFGVITIYNTNFPIGHKINLILTNFNNQNLELDLTNMTSDLMFNIRENWPLLSIFLKALKNNKPSRKNNLFTNLIHDKLKKQAFDNLSREVNQIKLQILDQTQQELIDYKSILVPFFYNEPKEDHIIKIYQDPKRENLFQFTIHLPINITSKEIILDGFITLNQNKNAKRLDLILKSSPILERDLQNKIYHSFLIGISKNNIKGTIKFVEIIKTT